MDEEVDDSKEICVMVILPNTQTDVMGFQAWCKERGYVWTSLDEVLPFVEEVNT